jgi:hypothetical protein
MVGQDEGLAPGQPHSLARCIVQPLNICCRPALLPLQLPLLPLRHQLLHALDNRQGSGPHSPLICGTVCVLMLLALAAGCVLGVEKSCCSGNSVFCRVVVMAMGVP